MKANVILGICIGLFICSCSEEDSKNTVNLNQITIPENVQMYIDDVSIKDIVGTRTFTETYTTNMTPVVQEISCHEFISDETPSFYYVTYSDSLYGADINKDGFVDMIIEVRDNLVKATIGDVSDSIMINLSNVGDQTILSFEAIPIVSTRWYRHTSWWECVRNVSTCSGAAFGVGIASMFYRYAFGYLATTAAIVCLDSRLRWTYDPVVKVSSFDKKYIFSAKCAEEFELSKPIILLDDVVMADLESLR
ncbi:hypothetical protein EAJ10_16585 [Bacteroides thetaiotaomicron]|jgi:putative lipoprotein|uniref:Lipoprotein n=1 Tax=Bacteroides thetaiotaomicron TaxID=818 RepID=A0A7J5JF36_BACT4|nr:hypothetical protein [Bacteroides thetaiotaomicron]KAB4415336.1 hypothetical protein GAN94_22810 [Bacteroides thetaiotaomicron]KAB4434273.1 hypothetical protein GAO03_00920 [Bacteroides thetaiotaomicron]KAB4437833.1 hypothetical protein GAN87_03680 [Bacteroides thetaiotaomicron]KAB4438592.1 hypothetical protein GAN99_16710 [Bacteroides thetaiotaomicron]KAB4449875.1 hypothetical protein GAN93_17490 [Bacteroides thetaiotaomicron]